MIRLLRNHFLFRTRTARFIFLETSLDEEVPNPELQDAINDEIQNISKDPTKSFAEKLAGIEANANKILTNVFKSAYPDQSTTECTLRVNNVLGKLRYLIGETEPINTDEYCSTLEIYADHRKKPGQKFGAFEHRSSAFVPAVTGERIFPKSLESVDGSMLNALGYRFYQMKDSAVEIRVVEKKEDGTEKERPLTRVPSGIKKMWPIWERGNVVGIVTMDGDGDMASRFAGGAMSYLQMNNPNDMKEPITSGKNGNPVKGVEFKTEEVNGVVTTVRTLIKDVIAPEAAATEGGKKTRDERPPRTPQPKEPESTPEPTTAPKANQPVTTSDISTTSATEPASTPEPTLPPTTSPVSVPSAEPESTPSPTVPPTSSAPQASAEAKQPKPTFIAKQK